MAFYLPFYKQNRSTTTLSIQNILAQALEQDNIALMVSLDIFFKEFWPSLLGLAEKFNFPFYFLTVLCTLWNNE